MMAALYPHARAGGTSPARTSPVGGTYTAGCGG